MKYNEAQWTIDYKNNDKTFVAIMTPKPINIKYVIRVRCSRSNPKIQKWFKIENKKRFKFTDTEFITSFNEQMLDKISHQEIH